MSNASQKFYFAGLGSIVNDTISLLFTFSSLITFSFTPHNTISLLFTISLVCYKVAWLIASLVVADQTRKEGYMPSESIFSGPLLRLSLWRKRWHCHPHQRLGMQCSSGKRVSCSPITAHTSSPGSTGSWLACCLGKHDDIEKRQTKPRLGTNLGD